MKDWQAEIQRLDGAYSPHTLRSYRNDFATFERWCMALGQHALPALPETVAQFVAQQSASHRNSTVIRRLGGIRKIHHLCGYPDPTADQDVKIAVRRARRMQPSRPEQALGLNRDLRDALLAATGDDLVGLRNRALIATGYDTLCRRSELVGLRAEDIRENGDGRATILVRRAKNDPYGIGRTAFLSTNTVRLLTRWLSAAQIGEGPVFRPVYRGRIIDRALNPFSIARLIKQMADAAGLGRDVIDGLSGHSMRVGAAQDLMTSGKGTLTIMRAGGWRSMNVVARYVENANLMIWD